MRVNFTTRIEDELLTYLKKLAIDEKVNVNDILEKLIRSLIEINK